MDVCCHHARIRLSERGFQISALKINRQVVHLGDHGQRRTHVFGSGELAGRCFQRRHLVRASPGEFRIANVETRVHDFVGNTDQVFGALLALAQVVHPAGQAPGIENCLQRLADLVGKTASQREHLFEQWNPPLNFARQFGIREPDKVLVVSGNQLAFVGIHELQLESSARRRIGVRIGDVAEQAGVAQSLHSFLEVALADVPAEFEPASGKDFLIGIALRSRDLDGDQLAGGDRGCFAIAGGLLDGGERDHGRKPGQKPRYE